MPHSPAASRGIDGVWDWVVSLLGRSERRAAPAADKAASSTAVEPPLIRFIQEPHCWTVTSPTHNYRGSFLNLRGALNFARQSYGMAPATLFFNIDGLVVVIPQEPGWPQPVIGDAR